MFVKMPGTAYPYNYTVSKYQVIPQALPKLRETLSFVVKQQGVGPPHSATIVI
jgi:hypothetical protein